MAFFLRQAHSPHISSARPMFGQFAQGQHALRMSLMNSNQPMYGPMGGGSEHPEMMQNSEFAEQYQFSGANRPCMVTRPYSYSGSLRKEG